MGFLNFDYSPLLDNFLEPLAFASLVIDVLSIIIYLPMIVSCASEYQTNHSRQSLIFLNLLFLCTASSMLDIPSSILENHTSNFELLHILLDFIMILYAFTLAVFQSLLYEVITSIRPYWKYLIKVAYFVICPVYGLSAIILSGTQYLYYYDSNGVYHRGEFWFIMYLIVVLVLSIDIIIIITQKISFQEKLALILFCIIPLIGFVVSIFVQGFSFAQTCWMITMVIIYANFYSHRVNKLAKQEAELTNSRVDVMLSQIQPHFLYNSLSAIAYLCDNEPKQAKKMILDFSDYLRGNLNSIKEPTPILFEKELQHIAFYLSLEQRRFGELLVVNYDIQAKNFLIPALTIQPLVENAVKHGLCHKDDGGTVTIASREHPDGWTVTITDDGIGFDPSAIVNDGQTHVGIDNVRARLQLQCSGSLRISSEIGKGTSAVIYIPREV